MGDSPRFGRKAGLAGALAVAAAIAGHFEGRNLIAYLDPVGIPTICQGVTRSVKLGDRATPAECDAKFTAELLRHKAIVDRYVTTPRSENREAALISFTYNVGEGNFRRSSLLRKLNAGDPKACDEMLKWVYAGGRKLTGLERRRAAERELCLQ